MVGEGEEEIAREATGGRSPSFMKYQEPTTLADVGFGVGEPISRSPVPTRRRPTACRSGPGRARNAAAISSR